ncbi:MAG: hypothetical protein ACI4JY_09175 [Oscillospiraceae bacterium]
MVVTLMSGSFSHNSLFETGRMLSEIYASILCFFVIFLFLRLANLLSSSK